MEIITKIDVEGYKSLRDFTISLKHTNVIIGENGAGKSNILQLLELISYVRKGNLQYYTNLNGGASQLLYMGPKITKTIKIKVYFNHYSYHLHLEYTTKDTFQIIEENIITSEEKITLSAFETETKYNYNNITNLKIKNKKKVESILKTLENIKKFHFVDTGTGIRTGSAINKNRELFADASNLASVLYLMKEKFNSSFVKVEERLHLIAPYFKQFDLRIDPLSKDKKILLEWRHSYNDQIFGPNDLSDGTLRALAILTAIYHNPNKSRIFAIDEPELGLHPKAIAYIVETLRSCSANKHQVIVATQSPNFLNYYKLNEVIVLEMRKGETIRKKLNISSLQTWLEDYNVGDLWEKNLLGGRP